MAQHPKPFIAGSSSVGKSKSEVARKKNPKYEKVQSLVETGVSKTPKEDALLHRRLKKSYSEEFFKKMKISTFVAVVLDHYKNRDEKNETNECATDDGGIDKDCSKSDSDFSKLISGIGEMDVTKGDADHQSRQKSDDLPVYLLLDVRNKEAFSEDHIITAKNYPHTMVTRAFNHETKDLVQYKHDQEKFILLYDETEDLSQKVCDSLTQRGYDNVYILCGGFAKAKGMFPKGLTIRTSKYNLSGPIPSAEDDTKITPKSSQNKQDEVKDTVKIEEFHPGDLATLQMKIDSFYGSKHLNNSKIDKERFNKVDSDKNESPTSDIIRKPRSKVVPWK